MMTIPEMFPIELTVDAEIRWRGHPNYIRHIFFALMEHKELLGNPDYKRLYDEALDYLFRYSVVCGDLNINDRENGYEVIQLLACFYNTEYENNDLKFSIDTVNSFLEKRRKIWNMKEPY